MCTLYYGGMYDKDKRYEPYTFKKKSKLHTKMKSSLLEKNYVYVHSMIQRHKKMTKEYKQTKYNI